MRKQMEEERQVQLRDQELQEQQALATIQSQQRSSDEYNANMQEFEILLENEVKERQAREEKAARTCLYHGNWCFEGEHSKETRKCGITFK